MIDKASREPPRLPLGPLELRLYAIAILAAVYLVAWRAIAGGSANPAPRAELAAQAGPGAPLPVWLDELPAAQRPSLALPPGWRLASRGELGVATATSRVVRASAPRPLRVRTRSS